MNRFMRGTVKEEIKRQQDQYRKRVEPRESEEKSLMDNKRLSKRLFKIAKKLSQIKIAKKESLQNILNDAERGINSGEDRGLELGIRDVKWLSEEARKIYDEMREEQDNPFLGRKQLRKVLLDLLEGKN